MAAAAAVPFGATRIIRLLLPTGQQSKSTSEEGKRWKEAISCERQQRWIGQISHERDLAPSCWWNALWRNSCPESTKTHTIAQHSPQVPRSIPFFDIIVCPSLGVCACCCYVFLLYFGRHIPSLRFLSFSQERAHLFDPLSFADVHTRAMYYAS